MRAVRLFAVVLLAALASTVPVGAQEAVRTADVKIVDFEFAPKDVSVTAGTTITWTNTGTRPHTVTDRGGTFDTNPVGPGSKSSISFTVPGKYNYFCRINPSKMNGTITVEGDSAKAKVNRIQALDPARDGAALSFDPATLTVQAGSTVVFANVGGKPHTLTSDDPDVFDTGVVTPGAEGGRFAGTNASITLNEPGTFPFHCEVHAVMKGVLTVEGEARAGPAAASAAPRAVTVEMVDLAFKPDQVSVAPGGKVTWVNKGKAPHNAVLDDAEIKTKTFGNGGKETVPAPTEPGSYSYVCTVHPAKMRAVLVVVGQNGRDPTAKTAVAAKPAAAVASGPGGGVSALVLATAVIGSLLAGAGISAFLRPKKAASGSQ